MKERPVQLQADFEQLSHLYKTGAISIAQLQDYEKRLARQFLNYLQGKATQRLSDMLPVNVRSNGRMH